MKILVVGDYKTGTGPANVTKEYIRRLGKRAMKLGCSSKPLRAAELIVKIPFSSVVLCSGYSAQNILAAKWAHLMGKKCVYLDHGSVEHEDGINLCVNEGMNRVEYRTLELCDRIYAVSHRFAEWLRQRYPEFKDKIDVQVNGVDPFKEITGKRRDTDRDERLIFSIGGGMPRKRINRICEAVELLRREEGYKELKLVVAGAEGAFSERIRSFDFTKDLGIVDKEEIAALFQRAGLFIQNSCFETFGLAPMEALSHDCDILVSKETGALELFDIKGAGLCDYIIEDCEDASEIAKKIKKSLGSKNAMRFRAAVNGESVTWEKRTQELYSKLTSL